MSGIPPVPYKWVNAAPNDGDGRWPLKWMGDDGVEEASFVDYPLLQAETFHLLAGPTGVGKGALCARWVARCTNGEMFGDPRPVIWIANEETPRKDLNPRIKVAGGDMMKVAKVPGGFRLPRDIDQLRDYATNIVGNVGLVVIDPIASHTGSANTNAEEEVRLALEPLAALAEEIRVIIIGVRHLSSKESRTGVLARILGSTAWVAVPRAILAAVKDNDGAVHVRAIKGSRVPDAEAGRKFRLEGVPLDGFERTVVAAIEDGESDADLDMLLERRTDSKSEKARNAIVRILREHGGELESDNLDGLVIEETGLSQRTMRNLRQELRERGWLRSRPENNADGKFKEWRVSLTNFAPYDRDLTQSPRARGGPGMGSLEEDLEETSLNLLDPVPPVPPYPTLLENEGTGASDSIDPTTTSDPTSPSPTCPICGSDRIGVFSGNCTQCGTKVNPQDPEVYG